jgi:hypothetical protein
MAAVRTGATSNCLLEASFSFLAFPYFSAGLRSFTQWRNGRNGRSVFVITTAQRPTQNTKKLRPPTVA